MSRDILLKCMFAIGFVSVLVSSANASPDLRKAAIVSTMTEAALSAAALLRDGTGQELRGFTWSSKYSDRNWTFSGSGLAGDRKVSIFMTGYVWGEAGEDLLLTYAGTGSSGDEPMEFQGKADWFYDKADKDYFKTDFRLVMKFGKNSWWGWVVGSEILAGATIGAVAAVAGTTIATGGIALGATAWIGAGGAVFGASSLVSVSETVRSVRESSEPAAAPAPPARPMPPSKGEPLKPKKEKLYVAISKDGRILGTGPDGSSILTGFFDNKSGNAKGGIAQSEANR